MSTPKVGTAILEIRTDIAAVVSNLGRLEKELAGLGNSAKSTSALFGSMGKALTAAFTVTAIIGAGKQVLDYAGHVSDLASRLKVSTTAVQQWEQAFGPAGVSIDAVAKASGELSTRLVGGDKSAVAALEKMGFSIEKLKAMAPEQRFNAVADAVGRLQNDGERLYASRTLFGKSGQELLAALDGSLQQTIDKFAEMGLIIDEETIKAADDFGDQIGFLGKQLLGILATVLGPLIPALSALGNVLSWLGRTVIGPVLNVAVKGAMTALSALWISVAEIVGKIADLASKLPGVGGKFAEIATWLRQSADATGKYVEGLWVQTDKAGDAAAEATPKLIGLGGATDASGKAAKRAADALKEAAERIQNFGAQAASAASWIGQNAQAALMQMSRFAASLRGGGFDPRTALVHGWSETSAALLEATEIASDLEINLRRVQAVEAEVGATGAKGIESIGVKLRVVAEDLRSFGPKLKASLGASLKAFPEMMVQSLMGGGGVSGALQAFGSTWGASISKNLAGSVAKHLPGLLGSTLSTLIGPLGAFLGPVLGKVWSGLRRMFGGPSEQELKGRDLLKGFEDSFGGFEQMVERVGEAYRATGRTSEQAQRDVKALLDATREGPDAVQRWIDRINDVFDEQRQRAEGIERTVSDLEAAVAAAGGAMPSHLRPMVERLIEIGDLTDDQKQRLRDLVNAGPNFDALQKEASEFGITLDALGPQFQQAHVTEEGTRVLSLFDRLKDAGADVGGVLLGMSDEVSGLVQQAFKYGAALPEGLRPIVENLSAAGELVDENGNKITDLSGLSFEETPLDKSSQAIVDAIDKLRELFEQLPGVAEASASGVSRALDSIDPPNLTGTIGWHVEPVPGVPGIDHSFNLVDAIPMAKGGFGRVPAGRPALFYSAGDEDFAFSGEGKSFGDGSGTGPAGVQVGAVAVNVYPQPGDDVQTLSERLKEALRTDASLYDVVGTVARRAVAGV